MNFLKKNWSNILLLLILLLFLLPQTRKPVQVFLNRIIAVSPSPVPKEARNSLRSYNWQLEDLEGRRQYFRSSKGRVILVNLWATWCPPCIAEMPSLVELYEQYGDKVDFYFVSNEEKAALDQFLIKKDFKIPVFRPLTVAPEQLRSDRLPTTYVLSRSGEVVVEKTGAANWNDPDLRELLETLLQERP